MTLTGSLVKLHGFGECHRRPRIGFKNEYETLAVLVVFPVNESRILVDFFRVGRFSSVVTFESLIVIPGPSCATAPPVAVIVAITATQAKTQISLIVGWFLKNMDWGMIPDSVYCICI